MPDAITVHVKYIGRRPEFTDRNYGTGLTFVTDQVREVPAEVGRKFLRHTDVFEEAQADAKKPSKTDATKDDTADKLAKAEQKRKEQEANAAKLQDLRDQVQLMDKDALQDFAKTKYDQTVPKTLSLDNMRSRVIGLIDQFGPV